MPMDAAKKKFLTEHLGSAEADRLERELAALEKQLREGGVAYKELDPDGRRELLADLRKAVAVLEKGVPADDDDVVRQLKQSRHSASAYLVDLIERGR